MTPDGKITRYPEIRQVTQTRFITIVRCLSSLVKSHIDDMTPI